MLASRRRQEEVKMHSRVRVRGLFETHRRSHEVRVP